MTLPWIWSYAIHRSTNTCLPGTRVPICTSSEWLRRLREIHRWLWFIGCAWESTLKNISFSEWVSRQTSTNENRITVAPATNRTVRTRPYTPDIAAQWVTFLFLQYWRPSPETCTCSVKCFTAEPEPWPTAVPLFINSSLWSGVVGLSCCPVACEAEAGGSLELVKSRLS